MENLRLNADVFQYYFSHISLRFSKGYSPQNWQIQSFAGVL